MSTELVKALKPCPFCNGEAEIERFGTRRQSTVYACTECGCRLETSETFGFGDYWNTRASDYILLATKQKLAAVVEEAARIADMHAASAWTVDGKREAQSIAKAIRASSKAPATGDTTDE